MVKCLFPWQEIGNYFLMSLSEHLFRSNPFLYNYTHSQSQLEFVSNADLPTSKLCSKKYISVNSMQIWGRWFKYSFSQHENLLWLWFFFFFRGKKKTLRLNDWPNHPATPVINSKISLGLAYNNQPVSVSGKDVRLASGYYHLFPLVGTGWGGGGGRNEGIRAVTMLPNSAPIELQWPPLR